MQQPQAFKPTSVKRHLIPAMYRWLSENDTKVFIHAVMDIKGVSIHPPPSPKVIETLTLPDGKTFNAIVLNTFPVAVRNFIIAEDCFMFECRMSGTACSVVIPFEAVYGLSCPNSGMSESFSFNLENSDNEELEPSIEKTTTPEEKIQSNSSPKKFGHLSLVK